MITRPMAATLSCRQCQSTILRAVVSRPTASSFRSLPQLRSRQLPIFTKRLFSESKSTEPADDNETSTAVPPEDISKATTSAEPRNTPWFLDVDPPRHPQSQHAVDLPKIPEDAPEVLEPMVKYIFEDMGLDEISLLDMRDLDPPAALGPNLIMLFGTARSERHLHVASGRFQRWLRKKQSIDARADGLIGPGELRTKLRRLRKKAKLMGTNTAIVPGGDNGISTGWVCVHFSSSGTEINEAASFDDSGRFSGFGAPQTGITVVVQCMTEARRSELDLENLWKGILKRNLQENKKARGETFVKPEELDQLLASKVQLSTTASAMQWQAMQNASQQRRNYSTGARRLAPSLDQAQSTQTSFSLAPQDAAESTENSPPIPDFAQIRKHIQDIQLIGMPITQEMLHKLINAAMTSPSLAENAAADRLALVDQLLLTAEERGMEIMNDEMFVTLIESGLASPSYGPELERSQKNLEYLMARKGGQLDHDQVLRLMTAYALRQDWTRFWDTFRMAPRFKIARDSRHYELAYRVMAASKSQKMCIDALRWVYPEMMSQDPPVWPVGSVYESLKACILVADPEAAGLLHNPKPGRKQRLIQTRRLQNREFLKVLREVEATRRELAARDARELAAGSLAQTVAGMSGQ
ncbi:hypothetical protein FZEAL_9142 [Fusarium zealandicum]|uniref:ATPase synthesis protein 25 n=1 Tax=Fusarium zealandicum TaxID=1053134 RepID=A0A8H4UCU1_9HYPO|nr:hypothetical protein FZEAL_9142 [Fusarium zealandicum]